MKKLFALSLIAAAAAAVAQELPNAGSALRDLAPGAVQAPSESNPIDIAAPVPAAPAVGGASVVLKSVEIAGNTVFSTDVLLSELGETAGKSFDLAGLRGLADKITSAYRTAGYPFARALLPAQDVGAGNLKIAVVEGAFGAALVRSDAPGLAEAGQPYLSSLRAGEVITTRALERAALILEDVPGVSTDPAMGPGAAPGTGDLVIGLKKDRPWDASIVGDNHGSVYTGKYRVRAAGDLYGLHRFGDQLSLRGIATNESLISGSVSYSVPLNADGLRGSAGLSRTEYELGDVFEILGATGEATTVSVGVTYPVLRSSAANLYGAVGIERTQLVDRREAVGSTEKKSITTIPLSLNFDRRDAFYGGGITYGVLGVTFGDLKNPVGNLSSTGGSFTKTTFDLVRIQALTKGFTAFGRLSTQMASTNLDSSQGISLGGANAVRAYPSGEAAGDEGTFVQLEVRYQAQGWAPYAFYDVGTVDFDAKPQGGAQNSRNLSGAGVGARFSKDGWGIDVALATRITGGDPQGESRRGKWRFLAAVTKVF